MRESTLLAEPGLLGVLGRQSLVLLSSNTATCLAWTTSSKPSPFETLTEDWVTEMLSKLDRWESPFWLRLQLFSKEYGSLPGLNKLRKSDLSNLGVKGFITHRLGTLSMVILDNRWSSAGTGSCNSEV